MKTTIMLLLAMAGATGFAFASLVLVTQATVRLVFTFGAFAAGGVFLVAMAFQGNPLGMYAAMAAQLLLAAAGIQALVRYGHALDEKTVPRAAVRPEFEAVAGR